MMLLGAVAETRVAGCLLSTLEPQNDTDSLSNEGVTSENMLTFTINGFGKLRSILSDMMEILCRPIGLAATTWEGQESKSALPESGP